MLEKIKLVKNNIIKATASYLRYHEDNHKNWDEEEVKIAEETIGILVLSGQKIDDVEKHYSLQMNKDGKITLENLPEGFPDVNALAEFIDYFEMLGNEFLKQIPEQYHTESFV